MSTGRHSPRDSDYSVIEEAGMTLGHSPKGLVLPGIDPITRREATRLCAQDYLDNHVFFNDKHFHNHLNHHLLATFSLGAPATRLQRIFDLNSTIQRPMPRMQNTEIRSDNYTDFLSREEYYPDFVAFFRGKLANAGEDWRTVATQFFFDDKLLPISMNGLFHPLIQLGYGLEFESQAIAAMGLAQACVHKNNMFSKALSAEVFQSLHDTGACGGDMGMSLWQIVRRVREDSELVSKVQYSDVLYSSANMAAAEVLAIKHIKHWLVEPTEKSVSEKFHELMSTIALVYGSMTRPGYAPMLEFAIMHLLTSSYFLPIVLEPLPVEQQAYILRVYAMMFLCVYAAKGCPELYVPHELTNPDTHGSDDSGNCWLAVFEKAIACDDIHVVKAVRGLWRGSNESSFEAPIIQKADYEYPPSVNWLYLAILTVENITASSFESKESEASVGRFSWDHGMVAFDEFWNEHGRPL
ncbi:hypothetical protein GGI07_000535 [Coemansia sp. Benny D115]|nr:hypothetical protein GGI07_000535 [Coemansia sp. Benny D115]